MQLIRKSADAQLAETMNKRKSAAFEMTDEERRRLLGKDSGWLSDAERIAIAHQVMQDAKLRGGLFASLSEQDLRALLEVNSGNTKALGAKMASEAHQAAIKKHNLHKNTRGAGKDDGDDDEAFRNHLAEEEYAAELAQQGLEKMRNMLMSQCSAIVEEDPSVILKADPDVRDKTLKSLLESQNRSTADHSSTLTALLMEQLSKYDEGRPDSVSGVKTSGNSDERHARLKGDVQEAAASIHAQIYNALFKVPHSSDWKREFRKQLGSLLKESASAGGTRSNERHDAPKARPSPGTVNMLAVGECVDDFADSLLAQGFGDLDQSSDAKARHYLEGFGRRMASRIADIDPRILDAILMSEQAAHRSVVISELFAEGLMGDTMPWWEKTRADAVQHALKMKAVAEQKDRVDECTQTNKLVMQQLGKTRPNLAGHAMANNRRKGSVVVEVKEPINLETLGLSHLLQHHFSTSKKKRRKIPKITQTAKKFNALIAELIQMKYIADCADRDAGLKPQSFSNFLQQFFQLKFGKQHARAYQQSMKQLNNLAAQTEHYYDKNPRVRVFARAAGILVCCKGGVCGCQAPDLLNAHIESIAQRKHDLAEGKSSGAGKEEVEDLLSKPRKSHTATSTGRGITRFRPTMANFWVDLVATAFGCKPSILYTEKTEAETAAKADQKKCSRRKQFEPETLAKELTDLSVEPHVFVPAERLRRRAMSAMPWLNASFNKKHKARFDFLLMNLSPRRVDSLEKVHLCVDTAADAICDFWDRETERHIAVQMDHAARTIEAIWFRAKALQRIKWMKDNAKRMRGAFSVVSRVVFLFLFFLVNNCSSYCILHCTLNQTPKTDNNITQSVSLSNESIKNLTLEETGSTPLTNLRR